MKIRQLLQLIYSNFIKIIPSNNFGDNMFSLIYFVRCHRRLPNKERLLSNYLFKLKHSFEGFNPLRAYVTDKAFLKDYVKVKVGDEYNVPTIKVLNSISEAKSFNFPQRCCIKPTHLSGLVMLRENGENIDFAAVKKWFDTNYYDVGRERNYRYLTPKLIVEPLIFDTIYNEDYKFFCYKGKAKFVQVDIDRRANHTRLYFDRDWNEQAFSILKKKSSLTFGKPVNFNDMLTLADELSADFEFIRVDLYTNGKQIYVGELTNWPENGNGYFVPRESEKIASNLLFSEI